MDEKYIAKRVAKLRIQKGISARDMSLSLGQSESYINKIENCKALPSINGLYYICDFFGITPSEFFSTDMEYPQKLTSLISNLKQLNEKQLNSITAVVENLLQK